MTFKHLNLLTAGTYLSLVQGGLDTRWRTLVYLLVERSEEVEGGSDQDEAPDILPEPGPAGQPQAHPAAHRAADEEGVGGAQPRHHRLRILHPVTELYLGPGGSRVPDTRWVISELK